jgi:ABC-2 type transport system ATP-binding protein
MSETSLIADHLVIVGRGRLLADTSVPDLIARTAGGGVRVGTSETGMLRALLAGPSVTVTSVEAEELLVTGLTAREVGRVAASHGIPLHELSSNEVSLEEAFMNITRESVEYPSAPQEALR